MPREEISDEEQEAYTSKQITGAHSEKKTDDTPPRDAKPTKRRRIVETGQLVKRAVAHPDAVPASLILIFGVCCFFLGALYAEIPFAEILRELDYRRAWDVFLKDGFELFLAVSGAAFFGMMAHNTRRGPENKGIRDSLTDTKIFRTILNAAKGQAVEPRKKDQTDI